MKNSYLEKYRPYDFECEEVYSKQAFNYERLEQAIINSHLELDKKCTIEKEKEKEKCQSDWDDILKIESIPEKCSLFQKIAIRIKNDLKYLKVFFIYKKDYAEYTSVNIELQRLFPITMFIISQYGALFFSIYIIIHMLQHGFNIPLIMVSLVSFVFSFIFRIAKIELDKTDDKQIIDNSFNSTIAIVGLIIAIVAIAVDINGNKNDRPVIKPKDCLYSINIEQIAYMSDADENGEHTIYFSNGVSLKVSQSAYNEIYDEMKK